MQVFPTSVQAAAASFITAVSTRTPSIVSTPVMALWHQAVKPLPVYLASLATSRFGSATPKAAVISALFYGAVYVAYKHGRQIATFVTDKSTQVFDALKKALTDATAKKPDSKGPTGSDSAASAEG